MKRIFDFFLGIFLIIVLFPLMLLLSLLIKLTSKGPIIFWSDRIGRNSKIFRMPKFRTMMQKTPSVATHLLENPESFHTSIGRFLRKTSLDELPQLYSIIIGQMSFVGPRPALYNQYDLISLRESKGINTLIPGLTGWAQVNGRDELSIEEKVVLDFEYSQKKSARFDLLIILYTLRKSFTGHGISH